MMERLEREKWQKWRRENWPFVHDNFSWSRVHLRRLSSKMQHLLFAARAGKRWSSWVESMHTGCFLHILENAIHFTLHKQYISSTWFIKKMWVTENACILKKNWVKLTFFFFLEFQKIFLHGIKNALEIYVVCQGM